jgi:hypothetical protein
MRTDPNCKLRLQHEFSIQAEKRAEAGGPNLKPTPALTWHQSQGETGWSLSVELAVQRRAREAAGGRDCAAAHYREVVRAWEKADSLLIPRRAAAARALTRLTASR